MVQSFSIFAQDSSSLSSTGLYKDMTNHQIADGVNEYDVQYPLWGDGVFKRRWIKIPAETKIDTSNGNWWKFPVGTKLWKEFSYLKDGSLKRIETRFIHHTPNGWMFSTYLWDKNDLEALMSNGNEYPNYVDLGSRVTHSIPSNDACLVCHQDKNNESPVLGFSALQLAHQGGKLNLNELRKKNLLTHSLPDNISIKSHSSDGAKAMGLIHGNCSHCHNPRGIESESTMNLKHDIYNTLAENENAYVTTINQESRYTFPDFQVSFKRILPGNAEESILYRRIKASNHNDIFYNEKMPPGPYGTMTINNELSDSLFRWIESMSKKPKS